jgi:HEAT repeat protein
MTKPIAFQTVIDALLDETQPFPAYYLHLFSDIEPGPLKLLLKAWPRVSPARQLALLEDLEELVAEDTLLCYDDLARALLDDPDPQVRVHAIRLLWECQDARLIPTLLAMLTGDSDANVRAAAATTLGLFIYLGEIEDIPAAALRKVEEGLLAVVNSNEELLARRRALESLGWSSRPEVPALIEAAYGRKEADWKVSALFAMGRSGDEAWGKHVLSNLRSRNAAIRLEAVRAAGELALASARAGLLDMLEDEEDTDTRHEIITALTEIGGEEVGDRLYELLEMAQDDEGEAEFLADALENLAFTNRSNDFDLLDFEDDEL